MNKIHIQLFKYLHVFFYLAFVFLWFKNNFPSLRYIQISYMWALIPLIAITLLRSFFTLKGRKRKSRPIFYKQARILLLIILLAVLLRVPFLYHFQGFNDGDDGLIMMQAKHLSEGELPSVYNYGVAYESSTLMHVYALLFKIFGYSILTPRLIALAIFIAFIVLQYLFLREIFSTGLALFVSLFYCLPIGHTMIISLNLSGDFPSILFFGTLSVYLSYLICFKDNDSLIPYLGFFMGLMFWIHQMTVSFMVTSLIIFALKYKLRLKKYFRLFAYGIIGAFPVVLSEVMTRFNLIGFLLSGKTGEMKFSGQVKRSLEILSYLLTRHFDFVSYLLLGLILLSVIGLLFAFIHSKGRAPYGIFVLFLVVFSLVYFLSKFSARQILSVRYFYPLYFVLPVVLFSFFAVIKTKAKFFVAGLLLLLLCFSHNLSDYYSDIVLVKQSHKNLKHTIAALEGTGEKYWVGDFWDSFLVTTLSGERIISYYHSNPNYYLPYFFSYFNDGSNNNFLFLKQVGMYSLAYREMLDDLRFNLERKLDRGHHLMEMLDRLGVEFDSKEIDESLLVYNIQEDVSPLILKSAIPESLPELELSEIKYVNMHMVLTFKVKNVPVFPGYRLWTEIPGYSTRVRGISSDGEEVSIGIPYPKEAVFSLKYYLDYRSIKVASSVHNLTITPSPNDQQGLKSRITYLSGFGPYIDIFGAKQRICEKEVKFEILIPGKRRTRVQLHLFSPFDFTHPIWRGRYLQKVLVEINHLPQVEETLRYGKSVIEFDLNPAEPEDEVNLIVLKFSYHLPLKGTSIWKTAAFLEKIELE